MISKILKKFLKIFVIIFLIQAWWSYLDQNLDEETLKENVRSYIKILQVCLTLCPFDYRRGKTR